MRLRPEQMKLTEIAKMARSMFLSAFICRRCSWHAHATRIQQPPFGLASLPNSYESKKICLLSI